jgi:hypothetical protein
VGQGVDEARQQRELSKAALANNLDRLEARVRSELDWRARLQRERGRLIGIGVGVGVVLIGATAILVLRRVVGGKKPAEEPRPITLEELGTELHELRRLVQKKNGSSGSLVQKAVLRGVSAAGNAGGTALAREVLKRQMSTPEGTETARGG